MFHFPNSEYHNIRLANTVGAQMHIIPIYLMVPRIKQWYKGINLWYLRAIISFYGVRRYDLITCNGFEDVMDLKI